MSEIENNQSIVPSEHESMENVSPANDRLEQINIAIKKTVETTAMAKKVGDMARGFENFPRSNRFFIMGFLIGMVFAISLAQYWSFWYLLAPFTALFTAFLAKELEVPFQSSKRKEINDISAHLERLKYEMDMLSKDDFEIRAVYEQSIIHLQEERTKLMLPKNKTKSNK